MKKIIFSILLSVTLISSSISSVESITKFQEIATNCSRTSENPINLAIGNGDSTDGAITPAPDPTWPSTHDISDKTTSFDDALEIGFDGSCGEYFQSDSDHDYYVYYAQYTNYFRFNVEYLNTSYYDCYIKIYKNSNLGRSICCYTNAETKYGSNIGSIEAIYAYQGDIFYFEIYQYIPLDEESVTTYQTIYAGYTAKIISANETDCDPSEYESNGYVLSKKRVYNGTDFIYCFLDDTLGNFVTFDYSYVDAVVEAMNMWNSVGIKQFVAVDSKSDSDIVIFVKYEDDVNFVGLTTPTDSDKNNVYKNEVKFNSYFMENTYNSFSDSVHKKLMLNVAIHELGHCLGINDLKVENNIMFETNSTLCDFGQWDIALYRYLWG